MARPVILPMFNMDMTEGILVRWIVDEGASVREGDPLCEIETDKVNMEVESPSDGVLAGRRYAEGDAIPVTEVIAYIAADAAEAASLAAAPAEGSAAPAEASPAVAGIPPTASASATGASDSVAAPPQSALSQPAPPIEQPLAAPSAATGGRAEISDPYLTGDRRRATPAVRRLARENRIALADISDDQGRVTMAAVKAAIGAKSAAGTTTPAVPAASAAPAGPAALTAPVARAAVGGARPLEGTRRRIAERMVVAHEAPHITLVREVQVPELMRIRKALAPTAPSVTALIAAATVRALLAHPEVNSTFENGEITVHSEVNLGIAVARPEGLIVPVIRAAEARSVLAINDEMKRISEAARTNRLTMADITGGTFTITSLGQAGIDWFSPLINPPQVAILGVGRVADRVVPIPTGIGVVPTVYLSLTCDHRVVDGAPGAEFLATLARELESPDWLWAGGAGG